MSRNGTISRVARVAPTNWAVVLHIAPGILATFSLAWIQTLLSDARLVVSTVCVKQTFWPAGRRSSLVVRQAGAGGAAALLNALRVRTAWAGLAGITDGWCVSCKKENGSV